MSDFAIFIANTKLSYQSFLSNQMSTFLVLKGRYSYDWISEIDSST
jgi:hypothetical protein